MIASLFSKTRPINYALIFIMLLSCYFLYQFQVSATNFTTNTFLEKGAVEVETIEKAKSKIKREVKRIMKKEEGLSELQALYKASDPLISLYHP